MSKMLQKRTEGKSENFVRIHLEGKRFKKGQELCSGNFVSPLKFQSCMEISKVCDLLCFLQRS